MEEKEMFWVFFQYNMKCPIYTVNLVCQNQIFFISKESNEKFP